MGRPQLHAHTFTETADLSDGDTVYLPAGRIHKRRYERLQVHVKEDATFRPLADDKSICCSFAYVPQTGEMASLLHVRANEIAEIPGATTIPTLFTSDTSLLRRAVTVMLDRDCGPGREDGCGPYVWGKRQPSRRLGRCTATLQGRVFRRVHVIPVGRGTDRGRHRGTALRFAQRSGAACTAPVSQHRATEMTYVTPDQLAEIAKRIPAHIRKPPSCMVTDGAGR